MRNMMQEGMDILRKAWSDRLGYADVGTVMLQPIVNKVVPDLVDYEHPIRMNLDHFTGAGSHALVNQRTAGSTPWVGVLGTDTIPEDKSSYARTSFQYETLATAGKVERFMQRVGRNYVDLLLTEMKGKLEDWYQGYEYWLTKGVAAHTSLACQIDGLQTLIPSGQQIATTTTAGGEAFTLMDVDELLDTANSAKMLIMTRKTRRNFNALLQQQQQFVDKTEVNGGFKLMSYNGVPIYVSTEMTDTQIFSGTAVTAQTGGTESTMFAIDTNDVYIEELTPPTSMALAKSDSQYDAFHIFCDFVLVVRNYMKTAKLVGILNS